MKTFLKVACIVGAFLTLSAAANAADATLLIPDAIIRIPGSKGKFDFLSVDPTQNRLLAAHEKDETADFIDLKSGTVLARLKVGPAVGIAADETAGKYYVSVQDDKRVAVIDAKTLTEISSISTPAETDAILYDEKDGRVYVTNDNGKYLWAIDPVAGKVVAAIAVPDGPECMAYDVAKDRIYMNSKVHDQVVVIDTKSNTVVTQWSTGVAKGPHGLVLDAKANRIYVSGDNGNLVAIDTQTGQVVGATKITPKVDQIAFDASTHLIFCAGPDHLSVVRATAAGVEFVGNVDSATTAKNVAVDPATHNVWTTYTDGTDSFAKSWRQP